MTPDHIHMIAFDVPSPPDYGGAIDMYWRLKALAGLGVHVTLHTFQYRRPPDPSLEEIVREVHYYPRRNSWSAFHPTSPHIVFSRQHPDLLKQLKQDHSPVLFEGLHTTALLGHPDLRSRIKAVRLHNIEHEYYRSLANHTRHPGNHLYYRLEAARLQRWESVLRHADYLFPISEADADYFRNSYGKKVHMLPFFQGRTACESLPGDGDYALYHGNLSVPENSRAALFLVEEVFAELDLPLVLAGKAPSKQLEKVVAAHPRMQLIPDPAANDLDRLIRNAQLLALPAMQASGMKGKLVESLLIGRHVIANPAMVAGTGLAELCHIAHDQHQFKKLVIAQAVTPFTTTEIEKRNAHLFPAFDADTLAGKLLNVLCST